MAKFKANDVICLVNRHQYAHRGLILRVYKKFNQEYYYIQWLDTERKREILTPNIDSLYSFDFTGFSLYKHDLAKVLDD